MFFEYSPDFIRKYVLDLYFMAIILIGSRTLFESWFPLSTFSTVPSLSPLIKSGYRPLHISCNMCGEETGLCLADFVLGHVICKYVFHSVDTCEKIKETSKVFSQLFWPFPSDTKMDMSQRVTALAWKPKMKKTLE